MRRFKSVISGLGLYYEINKKCKLVKIRLTNWKKEHFLCPICRYLGPFEDLNASSGKRRHAKCPQCGAFERHRLQYLVISEVFKNADTSRFNMLHFAPEGCFRDPLSNLFGRYETADLLSKNVDYRVDLTNLPFDNGSYNFVLASHVLEHIPDDEKAISEIRRILKPNGVAVLAVPIIGEKTIEYSEANINEYNHMRSPGLDYFCKFDRYFSRIEKFSSESQPEIHQTFVYEDRTQWPTKNCPNRLSMQGEKHNDYAFVCYV